jgi:hypothetical protein
MGSCIRNVRFPSASFFYLISYFNILESEVIPVFKIFNIFLDTHAVLHFAEVMRCKNKSIYPKKMCYGQTAMFNLKVQVS